MIKKAELTTNISSEFIYEFNLEKQINTKIMLEYTKQVNSFLEKQVREYSIPPIKGEITKNKIKWRGISLQNIQLPNGAREMIILQRGKQIGGSLKIDFRL